MKTIVIKEIEENFSVQDAAEKLISELENDVFKVSYMVCSYTIKEPSDLEECLLNYVRNELEDYDPTDEEVNEVYQLIHPKLEKMYNKEFAQLKENELYTFANRIRILNWLKSNLEEFCFVTPEEVLDTILKNGVENRS